VGLIYFNPTTKLKDNMSIRENGRQSPERRSMLRREKSGWEDDDDDPGSPEQRREQNNGARSASRGSMKSSSLTDAQLKAPAAAGYIA